MAPGLGLGAGWEPKPRFRVVPSAWDMLKPHMVAPTRRSIWQDPRAHMRAFAFFSRAAGSEVEVPADLNFPEGI
eukprot:4316883-Amphidinium_carterae.1